MSGTEVLMVPGEEPAAPCWTAQLGDLVDMVEEKLLPARVRAQGVMLVPRTTWQARPPRATPIRLQSTRGTKVHYTGGYVNPLLLDDHGRCGPAVRQIQAQHMDDNNWNDIGYTAVACPHRRVFIGRGPHVLPACNGPGLNSAHYGVLALVGNAGLIVPSDGQLETLLDAIGWLRQTGDAGMAIRGHRDGYQTDCPGEPLYRWVLAGAPRPRSNQEDQMPDVEELWNRRYANQDDPSNGWQMDDIAASSRARLINVEKKLDDLNEVVLAIAAKLAEPKP